VLCPFFAFRLPCVWSASRKQEQHPEQLYLKQSHALAHWSEAAPSNVPSIPVSFVDSEARAW